MGLLWLLFTFMKIGVCSFGGGYAMVPLLKLELVPDIIPQQVYMDILAISQMTPGPIAVNAATFIGAYNYGVYGSLAATFAVSLPSLIIIILLARFYDKFKNAKVAQGLLFGIRPISLAMMFQGAVLFSEDTLFKGVIRELKITSVSLAAIGIAATSFVLVSRLKLNPIYCLLLCAAVGLILI